MLGQRPPAIHSSEESLPRETSRTLSQLRPGYSRFLNTWPGLTRVSTLTALTATANPTPQPTFSAAPQTPLTLPYLTSGLLPAKPPPSCGSPLYKTGHSRRQHPSRQRPPPPCDHETPFRGHAGKAWSPKVDSTSFAFFLLVSLVSRNYSLL